MPRGANLAVNEQQAVLRVENGCVLTNLCVCHTVWIS
jgi:hypothetical protein